MKKFCPNCDKLVDVAAATETRCPTCMQGLADPPAVPAQRSGRTGVVAAGVLLVVAASAGGWWALRGKDLGPAAASGSAAGTAGADLGAKLRAAGLPMERAHLPGVADAAMQSDAKAAASTADLLAKLKALRTKGGLYGVRAEVRRKNAVLDTPALWQAAKQGKAGPIHAIEAGLLAQALLEARGDKAELITDAAPIATPLMLTRTRFALRLADGSVFEPLSDAPLAQPRPVSRAEAVATWLVVRANSARMRSEFKQVSEDLVAAEAIAPSLEAVRFSRGVAQLEQHMTEQGVATCDAAVAKSPDPLAMLFLAQIAQSLQQPVKALQRCEDALKIAPGLPEALTAKAMLLLDRLTSLPEDQKTKTEDEVSKLLEEALKASPPPPGTRAAKGQLMLMRKDTTQAEMYLGQVVREHKELEATLLLSQLLQSKQQFEPAVKLFADIDAPLDDERVVLAWTGALVAAKQLDKALEIADKALAADPDNHTIALLRADMLRQNGKVNEAIAALEPLKNDPDGERIALLQAQLYLQNHQANMAVPMLQAALQKKPGDRDTMVLYLVALTMGGQAEVAEKEAQRAVSEKVLKALEVIEIWLQAGDLPRAQKLLEAEVAADKPDPNVAATLAAVYVAQGQKSKGEALRDKVAAGWGDKAAEVKAAIDQAMSAAEGEAKAMRDAGQMPPGDAKVAP